MATKILAVPARALAETETLELDIGDLEKINERGLDGLKSGMFIVQGTGNKPQNYRLFNRSNADGRIDGVIAFDIPKAKLKEGENVIQRVQNGIIYKEVAQTANGINLDDLAQTSTKTPYKVMLEKQGFDIVENNSANFI